ncbi:hypothetical protein [Streptomyces coelicoflavus]|uniref:hypothetical protein n=1 Tax=Streptomyces coelicoflavus TaxID=285562 RepID=UPI002E2639CA
MRTRTTTAVLIAALTIALAGCGSSDDSEPSAAESSSAAPSGTGTNAAESSTPPPSSTGTSAAERAAVTPAEPTGAERDAVLAAVFDVNAKLTADEDKAIDAARNQCASLDGGATNPDHTAALRFSYDGITLTDDDGAHLNIGLRKTLCPEA